MKITKEQYTEACEQKDKAQEIINQFHVETQQAFDEKLASGHIWTQNELVYAAYNRCPCGAGLAHPKNCGGRHYWDCSAILTGVAKTDVQHCGQLPFMFYEVKSENQPSANGATTRPHTGAGNDQSG